MTQTATSPELFGELIKATMEAFVEVKQFRQRAEDPELHLCEIRFNQEDVDQYELANGGHRFETSRVDQLGEVRVIADPKLPAGTSRVLFDERVIREFTVTDAGINERADLR